MAISDPKCPKCKSAMRPGCPIESAGETCFQVMSTWHDGFPVVKPGLLWGERIVPPETGEPFFLFGLRCVECGFVEQYALTKPDIKALLAAMEKASRSPGRSDQEGTK